MSQETSLSKSQQAMVDSSFREAVELFEEELRKKHERISKEETNPNHVKQKAGLDYVDFAYMKSKAHEHYPGWSFKNLEIVHEMLNSGWVVVKGELHFYDNGLPRVGACAAAHRIAFKKDQPRIPENIVDLSNDVKAAVSDAMKKGFNVYMNISDDIYKSSEVEDIEQDVKEALYKIVEDCNNQSALYNYIDTRTTKANVNKTARKLLGSAYNNLKKEVGEEEAKSKIEAYKEALELVGINLN